MFGSALFPQRATAFFGVVAVLPSIAAVARADTPSSLDGTWSASQLTTQWVIGDWGPACGPRPAGGGEPAATVSIQQSGAELLITGGGRAYSTAQCWEQYPGIQRVGHSASPRAWKTTCKTPATDPRQETLNTSVTATDNSISFYEAGTYQFVVQNQNCTASVGRYRTYTLVRSAVASPASSGGAAGKAAPRSSTGESDRCAEPGPPARLDVKPSRKLLRAGEEFTFRAVVTDNRGCPVSAKPTWEITAGADRADLTRPGTVHLHPDAAEGEVHATASVGGRNAEVTIEVVSAERYDALLTSGAFNAEGELDEAAPAASASKSIGAASAVAEDRAGGRKKVFVAIIGGVALLLAIAGAWMVRRARRTAASQTARYEEQRAEYEAALKAPRVPDREPAPAGPGTGPRGTVCPVCGTQYGPASRFCGKDGATLAPMS